MADDIVTRHVVSAEILPLDDKHYGTNIVLRLDNGQTTTLNIWIPVGDPSDNELAEMGIDRAGWDANVEVDDMWEGKVPVQEYFPCDNHYQSRYELEVCEEIVNVLEARRG